MNEAMTSERETLEMVEIACIVEGERFRRDMGDIAALAESIRNIGLLQPIGIDAENRLVFGGRRIAAYRLLGRSHIPARRVSLDDIILGEFAENEMRKDFTVSERVAIARAIEERLAERNGVRRDTLPPEKFPEVPKGDSRDLAAERAGFGSGKTYEAAKKAVETLPEPLVEALDDGRLSIHLAAQVAKLPEKEREAVAEAPAEEVREAAQKAVKAHVAYNSGENEWYTPNEFIEAARRVMGGIDLDPASCAIANERHVQAETFYSKEDDGLAQPWFGRVWMNPPYAQPLIAQFAESVSDKFDSGEIDEACVLVNNATETAWFQRILQSASAACFVARRVRFLDPHGNPGAPLQGQAVLYLGDKVNEFVSEFSHFGAVLVRP